MSTALIHLLLSWVTLAAALWVATELLDGMSIQGDYKSYLAVAALFGILNFFLGKLAFAVLGVATLGLGFLFSFITRLVVDALLLKLADSVSSRLRVRSFGVAIVASLVISLVNAMADYGARLLV